MPTLYQPRWVSTLPSCAPLRSQPHPSVPLSLLYPSFPKHFNLVGPHALPRAACSRRRERVCVACGSHTYRSKVVRHSIPFRSTTKFLIRSFFLSSRKGGGIHSYQKTLPMANPRPVIQVSLEHILTHRGSLFLRRVQAEEYSCSHETL